MDFWKRVEVRCVVFGIQKLILKREVMKDRWQSVVVALAAACLGFFAGRITAVSVQKDYDSVIPAAKEAQSSKTTSINKPLADEENSEPETKKRKRYSNVRQQGDEFKLGLLDAKFDSGVLCWYQGDVDEHYLVKLTLTNNTKGTLLNPIIYSSSVKDDFGNACGCETTKGAFQQLFGGEEAKELRPGDSADFAIKIMPIIATATEFKGAVSFDGTGSKSWSRPTFYFRINKTQTHFTNKVFETDKNDGNPFIAMGDSYLQGDLKLTIQNVEVRTFPQIVENDEVFPDVDCYVVTCEAQNLSDDSTITPAMTIGCKSHTGKTIEKHLVVSLDDDRRKPLEPGEVAILKGYVIKPINGEAAYCSLTVGRWNRIIGLYSDLQCRLRISSNLATKSSQAQADNATEKKN